jgi:hypothetical protein
MWTTVLEYTTPILTIVGFGSGWLVGKYTFVGLQKTITTEIDSLKADVITIKSKLP